MIFDKQVDIILCFHLPYPSVTPKKPQKSRLTKKDHYTAILLEEVRDQFKFVIEKVDGMEGSLRVEMTKNKEELTQKIDDVQQALTFRIDNSEKSLSMRIDRLSEKIDRTHDIVLRHDNEITAMKKTA